MSRDLWIDVGTAPCGAFSAPYLLPLPPSPVTIAMVDSAVREQTFVPSGSSLYLASEKPGVGLHYSGLLYAAVPEQGPIRVRVVPPVTVGDDIELVQRLLSCLPSWRRSPKAHKTRPRS